MRTAGRGAAASRPAALLPFDSTMRVELDAFGAVTFLLPVLACAGLVAGPRPAGRRLPPAWRSRSKTEHGLPKQRKPKLGKPKPKKKKKKKKKKPQKKFSHRTSARSRGGRTRATRPRSVPVPPPTRTPDRFAPHANRGRIPGGLPPAARAQRPAARRVGRGADPRPPNGQTGWVRRADLRSFGMSHWLLVVDRRAERLTAYHDGRRAFTAPVGVGKPSTPTPPGHFWIRERFKVETRPPRTGPTRWGPRTTRR